MNAYKMNFATKTLTLTKAFADACADPASNEYAILTSFQHDFPELRIVNRTHRTPTKYHNANGEITHNNQFKNLTYENMECFINALPESEKKEKIMEAYFFLRYGAGLIQMSAYKAVREWFVAQFPQYRSNPLFYISNEINVIDFNDFAGEGQQEKKDA